MTGANGFVGRALCAALDLHGHLVCRPIRTLPDRSHASGATRRRLALGAVLIVNFAAVPDFHQIHGNRAIVQAADHAPVSHSVLPEALPWAGHRRTELARILCRGQALNEKVADATLYRPIERG